MANNRIYIGNKQTKEYYCFSKTDAGSTWREMWHQRDIDGFNKILRSDNSWNDKTELVLFTESDSEMFDFFTSKSSSHE